VRVNAAADREGDVFVVPELKILTSHAVQSTIGELLGKLRPTVDHVVDRVVKIRGEIGHFKLRTGKDRGLNKLPNVWVVTLKNSAKNAVASTRCGERLGSYLIRDPNGNSIRGNSPPPSPIEARTPAGNQSCIVGGAVTRPHPVGQITDTPPDRRAGTASAPRGGSTLMGRRCLGPRRLRHAPRLPATPFLVAGRRPAPE
jgi:hypothetical protein